MVAPSLETGFQAGNSLRNADHVRVGASVAETLDNIKPDTTMWKRQNAMLHASSNSRRVHGGVLDRERPATPPLLFTHNVDGDAHSSANLPGKRSWTAA